MMGAIAGDMVGSVYEHHPIKTTDFPLFGPRSRFTDDSVLTVAVADALLGGRSYRDAVLAWDRRYPDWLPIQIAQACEPIPPANKAGSFSQN